jgi:hypothetical protein
VTGRPGASAVRAVRKRSSLIVLYRGIFMSTAPKAADRRLPRLAVLLLATLAAIAGGLATPAVSSANPNPIDWRIYQSFRGALGNDVPLRYGQHDASEDDQGFGKYHIEDGHAGAVPDAHDIQDAVGNPEYCVTRLDGRVECNSGYVVVVYQPAIDDRSNDNRPFGIITAFYYLPCFAAGPGQPRACPPPPGTPSLPAGTSLRYTGPSRVVNGAPLHVSAVLADDLGTPVANRTVHFALGSGGAQQTCSGSTDRTGTAGCTIGNVAQPPATSIPLTVSFAGDGGFKPATTTVRLTAQSPTTLTYTGPTSLVNGSPAAVAASLTDGAGNAVINRTVRFELGTGTGQQACTGVTDGGGTARCTIDPVNQPPAPTVPLTISFAGDAGYLGSSVSVRLQLKTPTTLSYTGPKHIANGTATPFSATLQDFLGRPVADRPVRIILGAGSSAQTCTGTTDTAGTARCTIDPITQPLNDTATVPLAAAFDGDTVYLPSNATAQLLLQYATGRAYGASAQVGLPLLPPIGLPPQPDTGPVRTADATTTTTPCADTVSALVLTARALCPRVTTTLNPGTVTSTATVAEATIGLPGVPVIKISGLTATSTSRCAQATGTTTLTLTIGGVPTTVPTAPNSGIDLPGGARLIVNEQQPVTGASAGLIVNGVHITLAGSVTDIVLGSTNSAMHNCGD